MRQAVSTPSAPKAIGLYSQAIRAGSCCSCQARFRSTRPPGRWSTGASPRRRTASSRTSARSSKPPAPRSISVVRTTVYLADMNDFAAMNEVYGTYFSSPAPARATVQAARLPRDARVEIDVIARFSSN